MTNGAHDNPEPIDMVLHCPKCGKQHIDAPEPSMVGFDAALYGGDWPNRWTNPPHRTYLCGGCGHKWRPANVPTNGVAALKKEDAAQPAKDWWPSGGPADVGLKSLSENDLLEEARAVLEVIVHDQPSDTLRDAREVIQKLRERLGLPPIIDTRMENTP